ncbi:MAG: hypothetical protein NTV32_07070 [Gammaproteobacteria bacterium]|nr:hypothetical protein [Gammaproteobacteria bacterium]
MLTEYKAILEPTPEPIEITLTGSLEQKVLAIMGALEPSAAIESERLTGIKAQLSLQSKAAGEVTQRSTTILRISKTEFSPDSIRKLQTSAAALTTIVDINRPKSACAKAVEFALHEVWGRVAPTAAFSYGAGFALMCFSIISTAKPSAAGGIIFALILPALCSAIGNLLQASASIYSLPKDIHRLISSNLSDESSSMTKFMATLFATFFLFCALSLPAAAVISETVRHGLFALEKKEVKTGSTDHFIFEIFMQFARAMFLNKTLLTIPDTYQKTKDTFKKISANNPHSAPRKIAKMALLATPAALSIMIYPYFTFDKACEGNKPENNPIIKLYGSLSSPVVFGVIGTIVNAIVAGKLTLAGTLAGYETSWHRSSKAAVGWSVVSCLAGVATGVNNLALTFNSVGSFLYNMLYAIVANAPFFANASGEETLENLMRCDKELTTLLPGLTDHTAETLREIQREIQTQITDIKKTWGFVALGKKSIEPISQFIFGTQHASKVDLPLLLAKQRIVASDVALSISHKTATQSLIQELLLLKNQPALREVIIELKRECPKTSDPSTFSTRAIDDAAEAAI